MEIATLTDAISRGMGPAWHAHHAPGREAVILGEETLTYSELNDLANQLAHALRDAGMYEGESLAILSKNRIEFPIVYFGALRIGLRITPINWHLTTDEVMYILEDCNAKAVVVDNALTALAAQLLTRLDATPTQIAPLRLAMGDGLDEYVPLSDFIDGQPLHNVDKPSPGRQMLYTSGTTGRPKGVVRKPREARPKARRHYLPDHARVLCTGPLYHAAPLSQNLVQPLQQGKTVVVMKRFDAEETLRLIEKHTITHSHMVATMFHRMLKLPEEIKNKYDISSLETIWHGAAPTPIHVKHAMIDWLGEKLDEYYAATETGGTEITAAEWLGKPGSVGLPEEGQEIIILDDAGNKLPAGETGTVYFNAELSGGFEYHHDEEKTAASFRGSLYTLGDRGYLDEDGYLFLTGRSAELIISGGVNIYPAEIDAALLMHPAVRDAVVIGVPNEEFGEEVKAVVELMEDESPSNRLKDELIDFCREHLAHYKCPGSIEFVDELPRSDTGKVFRHRVREQYQN